MGRRQKYAEGDPVTELVVHNLHINGPRRYTPSDGESTAGFSLLTEHVSGDWSWKPGRDKQLGDRMRTFLGVPKGAAELYGPRIRN